MKILDIGCGPGTYVRAMREAGLCAFGIDLGVTPSDYLKREDILAPDFDETGYDLALCLEVAEHIPGQFAELFVLRVVQTAPIVIFSAAPPGQGGEGHVNLQPKSYWIDHFARHGFVADSLATMHLLDFLKKGEHMGWLVNNAIIFRQYGDLCFHRIEDEERPQAVRLATYIKAADWN